MQTKTRKLVNMAVLVTLAVALMVTIQIPLFPSAPFLKYDPSDIPLLIGGFWFGPLPGLIMVFIKAFLFLLIKGAEGPIGAFQNFMASGSFVFFSSLYYRNRRTKHGAITALVLGAAAMTLIMIPTNYIILPIWGIPKEAVAGFVFKISTPFNLVKGALSSVFTYLFYKRVKSILESLWS